MENKYVYFSTSCYDFYISVSVFNNLLKITFLKAAFWLFCVFAACRRELQCVCVCVCDSVK